MVGLKSHQHKGVTQWVFTLCQQTDCPFSAEKTSEKAVSSVEYNNDQNGVEQCLHKWKGAQLVTFEFIQLLEEVIFWVMSNTPAN